MCPDTDSFRTWSVVYSGYKPEELNGMNNRMGNNTNCTLPNYGGLNLTTILITPTTSSYPDHHIVDLSTFHPYGREYISKFDRGQGVEMSIADEAE